MRSLLAFTLGAALVLPGCALRIGPKMIPADRFNYSAAISSSWQTQMLSNLVKIRYEDAPFFMDVAQVVTSYTWEASGTITTPDWNSILKAPGAAASGRWAESPTITMNPLTGDKFTRSLLQPVPPVSIFEMVQAGWPIDTVFALAVRSINGLHALSHMQILKREADPEFYQLLTLMRDLQESDSISMRVIAGAKEEQPEIVFSAGAQDPETKAKSREVRTMLGLDLEASEFKIAFGAVQSNDKEIALATRSILEIIGESAAGVEIPEADVKEGRATPSPDSNSLPGPFSLVRVHSGSGKPNDREAAVSVQYRGHWFWVDDRDVPSKRGLTFLLMLATLAESGTSITPPVLTISKP